MTNMCRVGGCRPASSGSLVWPQALLFHSFIGLYLPRSMDPRPSHKARNNLGSLYSSLVLLFPMGRNVSDQDQWNRSFFTHDYWTTNLPYLLLKATLILSCRSPVFCISFSLLETLYMTSCTVVLIYLPVPYLSLRSSGLCALPRTSSCSTSKLNSWNNLCWIEFKTKKNLGVWHWVTVVLYGTA